MINNQAPSSINMPWLAAREGHERSINSVFVMEIKTKARRIPYSGGPRRLAFRIQKFRSYGSTSLLISNRFGVWSVVRHRHVKKSRYLRFHKLKTVACKLEKQYVSLRRLGVNDERVTLLRRRLADAYWDAMPAGHKVDAVDYFRQMQRQMWIDHFVFYPLMVVFLAATLILVPCLLMSDIVPLWYKFGIVPLGIGVLCKLGVKAWREVSDFVDNVFVNLLDQLAC